MENHLLSGAFAALIVGAVALLAAYIVGSRRRAVARRHRPSHRPVRNVDGSSPGTEVATDHRAFRIVYLIPCLNEERVIANTVRHLLATQEGDFAIMVIDDGSDDRTSDEVLAIGSDRVWLHRREAPHARQGKGEALNDAYRRLLDDPRVTAWSDDRVIVAVVDADGRLEPDATVTVLDLFAGRTDVGSVQIGVRINNTAASLLAHFQDVEFVVFTEIYQRARRRIGTVGLGGNGQYVRLSALRSLGVAPWSRCLTEDLHLGIRLHLAGWAGEYAGSTWVSQQGVTSFKRLLRQRTRWFQGHLQCLSMIPPILRSRLGFVAMTDLCWHLVCPIVILLMSITSLPFLTVIVLSIALNPLGVVRTIAANPGAVVLFFVVSFAPGSLYAIVYRHRTSQLGRLRALVLAHGFVVYGFLWIIAGWRATVRQLRGTASWTKTERSIETVSAASLPSPAAIR
jgi:1,2-diacylglycerol 3-beta-glucosyltransferase